MAIWLVRAGGRGENEEYALENNRVVIGWDDLEDVSRVASRDDLRQLMQESFPEDTPTRQSISTGQVWAMRERMRKGDLVVLPLKKRSAIAVGEITGDYAFEPEAPPGAKHYRPVRWLATDIPRSAFDQDLLYSFGALLTVCQPKAERAEERVRAKVGAGKETGKFVPPTPATDEEPLEREGLDLESLARDEIRDFITRRFKGHKLADLVAGLLEAQGYNTFTSPAGPDGGVDIIAGRGMMGFDPPRICVQVKSTSSPVDVSVVRELQGVMKNFGADHGLIVSWGGFKRSVDIEARRAYFEIRLWDSGDLISAIEEHFEKLPDSLQVDLPLKRVWALITEEQ